MGRKAVLYRSRGAGPPDRTPEGVISGREERIRTRRALAALLRKLACIALALWLLFSFLFGISAVRGESMYPRLRDGDLTVWYRLEPAYNIGDVVTFMVDGEREYGRVVARGGDTVDFSGDGLLLVNGSAQQEEIFSAAGAEGRAQTFPLTLGMSELFVLGDNRAYALDSRDFGPIRTDTVDGKIISLLRRRGI